MPFACTDGQSSSSRGQNPDLNQTNNQKQRAGSVLSTITGGTGAFEGATGFVQISDEDSPYPGQVIGG
jgi:hypothetical protein